MLKINLTVEVKLLYDVNGNNDAASCVAQFTNYLLIDEYSRFAVKLFFLVIIKAVIILIILRINMNVRKFVR